MVIKKGSVWGVCRMHCYGNLQTIKVLSHGLKKCSEAKTLKTRAKVLEPDHAQKGKNVLKKQNRAQSRYQGLRQILTSTQRSNRH